jgi:hypothetical protein
MVDIIKLPIRDDLNPVILQEISESGWSYEELKHPGDSRSFEKDLTTVWQCIHRDKIMWARADLVGGEWIDFNGKKLYVKGRYTNHMYYFELLDAIKNENGVK